MIGKKIEKIAVLFLSTILIGTLVFPVITLAANVAVGSNVPVGGGPEEVQNGLNIGVRNVRSVGDLATILGTVVQWIYTIFFIVAVLFILLAAYNFIQGGSNPEKVKIAKEQLKYAVIAIVIALLATAVSVIINNYFNSPLS